MFILLETGMPLQSGDEVFICDEDYVSWDDAVKFYGNVVYNEEGMMPVRRKISGTLEFCQLPTTAQGRLEDSTQTPKRRFCLADPL